MSSSVGCAAWQDLIELYEMDELQYRLEFPSHRGGDYVSAVVAGPTCDSDDAYSGGHGLVRVPRTVASGEPV
ncbi:hypothetical protein [Nocardia fusca]|uniref:hypothetical protein n=1 Tax=Nocardia fusca TaxID=941183 RepID=UPI0007A738B2|nr:hypothetical protein [Nocardia fusca]